MKPEGTTTSRVSVKTKPVEMIASLQKKAAKIPPATGSVYISPPVDPSTIVRTNDIPGNISRLQELIRLGKTAEAGILLNKLNAGKENVHLFQLAESYLDARQYEKAEEVFNRIKSVFSGNITGDLGLGNIEYLKGNLEKALEIYNGVLKNYPEDLNAIFMKGNVLYDMGEYENANAVFAKAKEIALKDLAGGSEDPESHYTLGQIFEKEGDIGSAINNYKSARQSDPDNIDAVLALGRIYREIGNYKEAINTFNNGLKTIDPKNSALLTALAQSYYDSGEKENYPKALKIYNELKHASSIDDHSTLDERSEYYILRGTIDLAGGKYLAAIDDLKNAEQIKPLTVDAMISLATAYSYHPSHPSTSISDYDNAVLVSKKILERRPSSLDAMLILNNCYSNLLMLHEKDDLASQIRQIWDEYKNNLNIMQNVFPYSMESLKASLDVFVYEENYEKSRECLQKIIKEIPPSESDGAIYKKQLLQMNLYADIEGGRDASIDGKPVCPSTFSEYEPSVPSVKIKTGPELKILLDHKDSYYIADRNNLRRWVQGHYREDLSRLSAKEAILFAARLTEYIMNYEDDTAKADLPHISIEEKIMNRVGVCRNFTPVFSALFECIRDVNPNLKNVYSGTMSNSVHIWNVLFDVAGDGITLIPIDMTWDKGGGEFGGNLEAFDDEHYNRFSHAANGESYSVYQEAIDKFPRARWADTAKLHQADILIGQENYNAAKAKLESIVHDFPASERLLEVYSRLWQIALLQGEPGAAKKHLKKITLPYAIPWAMKYGSQLTPTPGKSETSGKSPEKVTQSYPNPWLMK